MALSFPPFPVLNQIYIAPSGISYKWDGEKWTTSGAGGVQGPPGPPGPPGLGTGAGANIIFSADPPVPPIEGQLWYDTDTTTRTYTYYSNVWLDLSPGLPGGPGATGPIGATGPLSTVPGSPGATGASGPASTQPGPPGATGPAGATGPGGSTGPSGAPSVVPGATGASGPAGPTGATGPASTNPGPPGSTGPAGVGATGASGATGPAGPTGASGPLGAPSIVPGPPGATGATGPASTQPGPPGATGTAPSTANFVTTNTVQTVSAKKTFSGGLDASSPGGSFSFNSTGSALNGAPATGYFTSSTSGRWALIGAHLSTSGSAHHGIAAATYAAASHSLIGYNLVSGTNNGRSATFLNGQGWAGYFVRANEDSGYVDRTSTVISSNEYSVLGNWISSSSSGGRPTYQFIGCDPFSGSAITAQAWNDTGTTLQAKVFIALKSGLYGVDSTKTIRAPSFSNFTGTHDGIMDSVDNIEIGDIVVDDELFYREDISSVKFKNKLSSQPNQRGVLGVISSIKDSDIVREHIKSNSLSNFAPSTYRNQGESDEEFAARVEIEKQRYNELANSFVFPTDIYVPPADSYCVDINSLGEGQINVCGEGGNIERGDLIVTSSIPGKGMKQADDIVRSYTVAKARESMTFSSSTEVKMIACIYLSG